MTVSPAGVGLTRFGGSACGARADEGEGGRVSVLRLWSGEYTQRSATTRPESVLRCCCSIVLCCLCRCRCSIGTQLLHWNLYRCRLSLPPSPLLVSPSHVACAAGRGEARAGRVQAYSGSGCGEGVVARARAREQEERGGDGGCGRGQAGARRRIELEGGTERAAAGAPACMRSPRPACWASRQKRPETPGDAQEGAGVGTAREGLRRRRRQDARPRECVLSAPPWCVHSANQRFKHE